MYGQMTAGSWIYIGSQGIVQGTYETFAEVGRRHYGGNLAGRWILTAGLGGMGGAQPLAATMAGASMLAVECQPCRIEMRLQDRLSRHAGQGPRRGAGHDRARPAARRSRSRSACSAMRPRSFRNWCGAASSRMSSPTRPPRTIRSTAICPPAGRWRSGKTSAPAIRRRRARRARNRWRCMCAPCSTSSGRACRRSTTATTSARWRRKKASTTPSIFPASCRPISARCSAAASARSAGRRCPAIRKTSIKTDAKVKELMPHDRHLHNWLDMAQRAHQVPGPAGAHLLGRARRPPPPRARLQRDGGERRIEGADRDRPRSSRFRLGGQPQPRDRGDEGRLRRGVRLAAAQRAAELRLAARPGCRCITAAASASAIRSTPAW